MIACLVVPVTLVCSYLHICMNSIGVVCVMSLLDTGT